jgi:multidrug efflux pump
MMNRNLPKYNEVKAFPIQEQTISVNRRGGLPVQFVLQHNDFEKIKMALPRFMEAAGKSSVFAGVDADLKFNKPELRILIDRLRASTMGVSTVDIAETLQLALTNRRFGYFIKEGKQYQVMGQVARIDRDDPKDLKNLYVRSSSGQLYPLDQFVTITEETTPPTLYHFNRYKSATVSAGLAPGKTIGDGIQEMEAISKTILQGKCRQYFFCFRTGTGIDFFGTGRAV